MSERKRIIKGREYSMEEIRLNSYIAKCGIASRRKADELIKKGVVFINSKKVVDLGQKVKPSDNVSVNGKIIKPTEDKLYILLNKPVGVISSSKDEHERITVMDIIGDMGTKLHTVGRLDYDTEGLIILTNDGELTYKLTHPKYHVDKTYVVKVKGILNNDDLKVLRTGIVIDDNYKTSPAKVKILKTNKVTSVAEITIHEGKNRQIRKMFSKIGHEVIALKRTQIGHIAIGNLKVGKWRNLSKNDIEKLFKISHNR